MFLKHKGFTLVELLVVVAIIVVLLALLVPAMDKAMTKAEIAVCLANMHQIGIGQVHYSTDHRQVLVPMGQRWFHQNTEPGLVGDGRGWNWMGLLHVSGALSMRSMACPADDREFDPADDGRLWMHFGGTIDLAAGKTTTDEGFQWGIDHPVSYAAQLVGFNLTGRRLPQSGATNGKALGLTAGMLKRTNVPSPGSLHALWDGYLSFVGSDSGILRIRTVFNDSLSGGLNWSYHRQHFRHNPQPQVNTPIGPNALFVDGHAEPTVDLFGNVIDDNLTFER